MTDEIIQSWPRWKRWGLYALAGLTGSGLLPALGCAALEWVCEATTWWLLVPLLAGELYVFWRAVFE